MRFITSHDGVLQELSRLEAERRDRRGFVTGLGDWDEMCPRGSWQTGAVHELLYEGEGVPVTPAVVLARASLQGAMESLGVGGGGGGKLVWSESPPVRGRGVERVFAPALVAAGVPGERLLVLRPPTRADELWAVAECLRCPGVAVVVARLGALSRIWARRLQLSAERGGGTGIFLRPRESAGVYAAATRWGVRTVLSERAGTFAWEVRLEHAVGKTAGGAVRLEVIHGTRENWGEEDSVRAVAVLGDGAVVAEEGARVWRRRA